MASRMMPSTSSMTAPARMVTPSWESSLRLSERMRAVMETEVAVHITPSRMVVGSLHESPSSQTPIVAPAR